MPAPAPTVGLLLARPFSIVRPAMVTATGFWFWLTLKTRLALLPLMASKLAPGPSMSRLLLIASSSLVSVIVWPLRLGAKTMLSPLLARPIASRREPAPLSWLFRTVSVLRAVRSSRISSRGTNRLAPATSRPFVRRRLRGANHIAGSPVRGGGLRYNDGANTPGAQTERRGEAGPVRVLLGGGHAPAAFLCNPL